MVGPYERGIQIAVQKDFSQQLMFGLESASEKYDEALGGLGRPDG